MARKLQIVDNLIKQAANADTVDGKHASDFVAASGWTAGKCLGVDDDGNVVEKDAVDPVVFVVEGETLVIGSDSQVDDLMMSVLGVDE